MSESKFTAYVVQYSSHGSVRGFLTEPGELTESIEKAGCYTLAELGPILEGLEYGECKLFSLDIIAADGYTENSEGGNE